MEEESNNVGFQYVIGKKRSNQKRRRGKREKQEDEEEEEKKGGKLLARRLEIIASKRTLLLTGNLGREIESFLDNVFSFINEGEEIPCSILTLGLGSIKDSKAAQVQLAFLLIVRDKLSHLLSQDGGDSRQDRIEVQAYDPIFNQEDHELLSALDITTTDDNLQGCYVLKQATFVFMPHCTKTLYENILRSNWTPTGLKHLWLCCNELERYVNGRSSDLMIPCIKRIVGRLSVYHLPILSSSHNDALNDIAIQRLRQFDIDSIEAVSEHLSQTKLQSGAHQKMEDFWVLPDAPVSPIKDVELL